MQAILNRAIKSVISVLGQIKGNRMCLAISLVCYYACKNFACDVNLVFVELNLKIVFLIYSTFLLLLTYLKPVYKVFIKRISDETS